VIKAAVRRDGPGEWSFTVADDRGEIVTGVESSWAEAYRAATAELSAYGAGEPADPGVVIRGRWTTVIPGDATVPPGNRWYDGRPSWRRWLGLP
jgi:hypothetical protein